MTTVNKLMRLPAVLAVTSVSRSTVLNKVKAGKFPKPFKLSERIIAWRESDIAEWMKDPMGWAAKQTGEVSL